MNIPAQKIIHHIDVQVAALKKAAAAGEAVRVSECATAIEAYCQLLKGAEKQEQAASVNQPTVTPKPLSFVQPTLHEKEEDKDKGSLLDF
ncbi:DUF5327 family protein [Halalkalibacter oceani]|uniref:YwdI family protein n=1 Tax=Halalkalibacter oceani TaxID=1653776 RepID=A0A9X2DPQ4_9BACI|nr:DUF5327 family protein [Halalkalibacter oceani]MCM3714198.1 YwdI family protein [Halalkalibacter oceani]